MTLRRLAIYSAATLITAWVTFPLVLITLAAFTPRDVLYSWPRSIWPARFTLDTMAASSAPTRSCSPRGTAFRSP